jgi:hypothetical protein
LGKGDGSVGELRGTLLDGGRGGNWILTVSRERVSASGAFATGCGGKALREFSFFGSFVSAIGRANQF